MTCYTGGLIFRTEDRFCTSYVVVWNDTLGLVGGLWTYGLNILSSSSVDLQATVGYFTCDVSLLGDWTLSAGSDYYSFTYGATLDLGEDISGERYTLALDCFCSSKKDYRTSDGNLLSVGGTSLLLRFGIEY